MVPNSSTIMLYFALLVMFWGAESLPQPSNSSDCKVPPDLSSCGEYLEGDAPKPSALCCGNLTLAVQASDPPCLCRGEARSLADACKLEARPCYDGFGMTESPTESPKEMRSSSNRSVNTEGLCAGCETGTIDDPGALIPSGPP